MTDPLVEVVAEHARDGLRAAERSVEAGNGPLGTGDDAIQTPHEAPHGPEGQKPDSDTLTDSQRAILESQEDLPHNELAMWEVQRSLADVERRITEYLATMMPDHVPGTLFEIDGWFRTMQRIRQVVEAKAEAVWSEAVPKNDAGKREWVGPDGDAYDFKQPRSRTTDDPEGLRADLIATARERGDVDALPIIEAAFPVKRDLRVTPLDTLAERDESYAASVSEFLKWKDTGKPHLARVTTYKHQKAGSGEPK